MRGMSDLQYLSAAWSATLEPGDPAGGVLWNLLGPEAGLAWMQSPVAAPLDTDINWKRLHARTHPRASAADPQGELRRANALGATLITREDPDWPESLSVLGDKQPFALWIKGNPALLGATQVAVVGARASTAYGNRMAEELSYEMTKAGLLVTSGGAYGIDAAAHRGALGLGGTVAVLCGGLGHLYPKGNEDLLNRIGEVGLLVSEVPPGFRPARWRFIERNRIIAALSKVVIVVEAGVRSGARATANRALDLGIDVGAVPGPVTSAASAGCHQLIREGAALVSGPRDVMEMLGDTRIDEDVEVVTCDPFEQRIWDAFPSSRVATKEQLVVQSGLSERETDAALVGLSLRGAVALDAGTWRRL